MTDSWQRVKQIFFDALDLEPAERAAFLDAACEGEPELRAEVERLLAGHERSAGRFEPPWERLLAGEDGERLETLGDFDLIREIGRGGRGVVYLAFQRSIRRKVALKVLDRAARADEVQRERFRREGSAAAKLDHPGIVRVHGAGEENGVPYLAMDYVEGNSLADELRASDTGRLFGVGPGEHAAVAATCVLRVAEALAHAHSRNVIHRDVKPQNILIDSERRPMLVDFGLARDIEEVTITLDLEGTPNYMSPEQVELHRLVVDHRTDIYSLGVILYELLTGTRPFAAPTAAQILRNVTTRIPQPVRRLEPSVPVDLETICHAAMAKRPGDRYATADELAADLRSFLEHRAIARTPPGVGARLLDWCGRHRLALAIATLVVLGPLAALWIQREMEWSAGRAALDTALAEALAGFDELDAGTVRSLRARVADWRERWGGMDGELAAAERRFEAADDRRQRALDERARAVARRAFDGRRRETLDEPEREHDVAAAVRAVTDASLYRGALEPELADDLVRVATARLLLTVESDGGGTGQTVFAQRVDPVTNRRSEPEELGRAPLPAVALAPGLYRITVVDRAFGFAEVVHDLRPGGREIALTAHVRATDEVVAEMRAIPPATYEVEDTVHLGPDVGNRAQRRRQDVRAFWLDAAPVTNAEYEAFCAATDRRRPLLWPEGDKPDGWAERPVVMVSLDDARRYAEWAGKRLPTRAEWELAARGPDRSPLPWRSDDEAPLARANLGRPRFDGSVLTQQQRENRDEYFAAVFEFYMRSVVPVRHFDAAGRGPHDLHDLIGNVWEWVEARPFDIVAGEVVASRKSSYRLGLAYHSSREMARKWGLELRSSSVSYDPRWNIGFRCAKSRTPLQPQPR